MRQTFTITNESLKHKKEKVLIKTNLCNLFLECMNFIVPFLFLKGSSLDSAEE